VLGPGVQSARRAIANGDIGVPMSAQTVMQYAGPDIFHPNPEFLFARGAGPLFDMGPYYLTTLIHIFGPVATVAAVGSKARTTRTVQVGDRLGTEFPVEVPTHVSAIAQFAGGGVSQSVFSFQSPLAKMGFVEITGTEGTLIVPDPNAFTGEVKITRAAGLAMIRDEPEWEIVPITGALAGRGLGVLDMARSIRSDSRHMASGELGYHVLDILVSIEEAIESRSSQSKAPSILSAVRGLEPVRVDPVSTGRIPRKRTCTPLVVAVRRLQPAHREGSERARTLPTSAYSNSGTTTALLTSMGEYRG
jgi:predicted dehydrogenase